MNQVLTSTSAAAHVQWRAAAIQRDTPDAVTIVFDTGGREFNFSPGQFLNLRVELEGVEHVRSYSICSAPGDAPAITVKKTSGGLVSNYIHQYAEEIQTWDIDGPFGNFLVGETASIEQAVFIAGGSGITPIYPMILELLQWSESKVHLIYTNKSWSDTIFRNHLMQLEREHQDRFQVTYSFTAEGGELLFPRQEYISGRLSRLVLKKLMKKTGATEPGTKFFVCGPAGLITVVEDVLKALEIPAENVRMEYFTSPAAHESFAFPAAAHTVLLRQGFITTPIVVPPGISILDAGLEQGLTLPYSCKSGTCGSCAAIRISGELLMRKNHALDNAALNEGYVLLCQSYPADDQVVIGL